METSSNRSRMIIRLETPNGTAGGTQVAKIFVAIFSSINSARNYKIPKMTKSEVLVQNQVNLKSAVLEFRIVDGKVILVRPNDQIANGPETKAVETTISEGKNLQACNAQASNDSDGMETDVSLDTRCDMSANGIAVDFNNDGNCTVRDEMTVNTETEKISNVSTNGKTTANLETPNDGTETNPTKKAEFTVPDNSTLNNESEQDANVSIEKKSANEDLETEQNEFVEDDLEIGDLINVNSKGTVHRAVYRGNPIILKLSHPDKRHLSRRLKEVEIYNKLKSLQGECIPKLLFHGYLRKGLFCIGITDCGKPMYCGLTESQRKQVAESLVKIHQLRVAHYSMYRRNLVIDNDGKIWIIDFDNSSSVSEGNDFLFTNDKEELQDL